MSQTEIDVHEPGSGQEATAAERAALTMAGLWDDSPCAEFSQSAVLDAYRTGYEDGAR